MSVVGFGAACLCVAKNVRSACELSPCICVWESEELSCSHFLSDWKQTFSLYLKEVTQLTFSITFSLHHPTLLHLTFFNSPSLPFCLHMSSIKSHSLQFSFLGVEFQNYYIVIYLFGHMNTFVWIFSSFFCLENKSSFLFFFTLCSSSINHWDHEWNGNALSAWFSCHYTYIISETKCLIFATL